MSSPPSPSECGQLRVAAADVDEAKEETKPTAIVDKKMAEVITLSDSDDDVLAVSCSAAPMVTPARAPMGIKTEPNRGFSGMHIGTPISINHQFGIKRAHQPQQNNVFARNLQNLGPITLNRMGPPMSVVNRLAIQSINKRPPPPPPGHMAVMPSTSSRTRNQMSQVGMNKLKAYEGHYMFEAAETDELGKRTPRSMMAKKFDGKFVCSYNPSKCYKLCNTTVDMINHIWSHVLHDPPPLPAAPSSPVKPTLGGLMIYSEGSGTLLADNCEAALVKMHTCDYCLAVFKTIFEKQDHIISCHICQDTRSTVCNICEMDLKSGINLENHLKKHAPGEAPYNCSKCKYRTSVRQFLLQHYIDRHSHENLLCPFCLYHEEVRPSSRRSKHIFVRSFIEHMRLHTTIRQFRCRLCALSFNSADELAEHKTRDHEPLNTLWQVRVRRNVHEKRREMMTKSTKITMLQKMYLETLEGKRVADEVSVKGDDRMGVDTSMVGDVHFKCECGFASFNGNRVASHFHSCRRRMKSIYQPREDCAELQDPEEELEVFAVFPPFTGTELESKAEFERRVEVDIPDEAYILNTDEIEFQETDDLLMLKMMANEKDTSDEIIDECVANVVETEEE